jgi:hypothetical protein
VKKGIAHVQALRMRRLKARLLMSSLSRMLSYSDIESVERIDRMAMSAEARRSAALREIERNRAGIAEALRHATDDVVDAVFEEVAHEEPGAEVARDQRDEEADEDEEVAGTRTMRKMPHDQPA